MPITENQLNEALNRAAALMTPEGQSKIQNAGKKNINNFNEYGDYIQSVESQGMRNTNSTINQNKTMNIHQNNKLPKVIQDSLKNNPINEKLMYNKSSVLDTLEHQNTYEPKNYTNEQYITPIVQQPIYQQPQYPQITTMGIDYNYIRNIVNECIQANLKQIKDEILKESNLKVIRMANDNKIQLIDNKNNLFESKLEFKKNISKK